MCKQKIQQSCNKLSIFSARVNYFPKCVITGYTRVVDLSLKKACSLEKTIDPYWEDIHRNAHKNEPLCCIEAWVKSYYYRRSWGGTAKVKMASYGLLTLRLQNYVLIYHLLSKDATSVNEFKIFLCKWYGPNCQFGCCIWCQITILSELFGSCFWYILFIER